jgi:hypothetical protein
MELRRAPWREGNERFAKMFESAKESGFAGHLEAQ